MEIYVRGSLTVSRQVQDAKILAAKILISQTAQAGTLDDIRAAEFKVFSQFGEDGIIQYLVRKARIPTHLRTFVEFGGSVPTMRRIRAFLSSMTIGVD